ncbi:MAG: hypothetical protein HY898_20750 [Deltaproteobacteria bacterium]|nr:hypothetical protein [Deltaproteobacteria bacterium]
MRMTWMSWLMVAAPCALVGCGGDDPAPAGTGGEAGSDNDAGLEAEPEASPDTSPEVAAETTAPDGDAATGACKEPPRKFWIYDLSVMPPEYKEIAASCQAYGDHSIIYVADDIWGTTLKADEIDKVQAAFEKATPADPAKGIYDIATGTFGKPTDVDSNDRIILLYYEIQGYAGYQFDGFIRKEDMVGGTKGNDAEILYLDGVRNPPSGEYMLGVASHEFEHMILLNNKPGEAGWLDETMAETSMIACGYYGDLKDWVQGDFAKNPTQSLTTAPPKFNYGAGFLFGGYLYERFGSAFFTALMAESSTSMAGIDKTLSAQGKTDTFKTLLPDWSLANFLDQPALQDGRFGYKAFDVPAMTATVAAVPAAEATFTLEAYSSKYLLFTVTGAAGSTLDVKLSSTDFAALAFRWAAYPEGDKGAAQVGSFSMASADETLSVPAVGDTVNRVVIAAVDTGGGKPSFKASAAMK